MPKPTAMTLTAQNRNGVMHAVQTTSDQQGDRSVEGDWFLDGKEHPFDINGPNQGKMLSRWDGSTLVSERHSNDGQYVETTRLTLSSDGKVATEKIHVKNPNGVNDSTLIWERK